MEPEIRGAQVSMSSIGAGRIPGRGLEKGEGFSDSFARYVEHAERFVDRENSRMFGAQRPQNGFCAIEITAILGGHCGLKGVLERIILRSRCALAQQASRRQAQAACQHPSCGRSCVPSSQPATPVLFLHSEHFRETPSSAPVYL